MVRNQTGDKQEVRGWAKEFGLCSNLLESFQLGSGMVPLRFSNWLAGGK